MRQRVAITEVKEEAKEDDQNVSLNVKLNTLMTLAEGNKAIMEEFKAEYSSLNQVFCTEDGSHISSVTTSNLMRPSMSKLSKKTDKTQH